MEQTSAEFIKNRSFEIAWAVFRCANIIKQPKLKIELENASVDVIANLEVVDNLEKLEQLIRLAEVVGEIGKTNAFILFREIDNLKEAVRQWNSAIRQEKEDSSAIDRIFVKAPGPLFDINNSSAELTTGSSASLREVSRRETMVRQGSPQVVRQNLPQVVRQSENSSASSASLPEVSRRETMVRSPYGGSPEGRQNSPQGVFKKVKELGKTTTKELLSFFPGVSERTVRFYLLRLCEQGLVSRIGSTGPGSYYVAK